MADPVLYGPAYSTYARTARLALEEKGVPYELVEVDMLQGMPEEQKQRHPFAKVPTLEHDGFQLYETAAIARYVDEAFEGPDLQPGDARAHARLTQITCIIDAYAYRPMIGTLVIQRLVTPMLGGEADEEAIDAALPAVRHAVEVLEGLIGDHAFFTGAELSLADLHVAPPFAYLSQTPEGKRILRDMPNLTRWWESVSGRASMQRTAPKLG